MAGGTAPRSDLLEALTQEAERVGERSESPTVIEQLGLDGTSRVQLALGDFRSAAEGEDPYRAVRRLMVARFEVDHAAFRAEHTQVQTTAALEQLIEGVGAEIEEILATPASDGGRAAAMLSLEESARVRARLYLASAGGYANAAGVPAGVYYLGYARCYAGVAAFVAELPCPDPGASAPDLPGLAAYIERLASEGVELYRPPLSQTHHADFTRTNASLKVARQLEEAGASLGAFELAADAHKGIGRLRVALTEAEPQLEGVEALIVDHRERVQATGVDHSLVRVLLDEAEASIASYAHDGAEVDLGEAVLVLEEIVPAYFECMEAGETTEAQERAVTITLVRWPFT